MREFGALAILAALRHRDRTGGGSISMSRCSTSTTHCHEVSVHQHSGGNGQIKPTARVASPTSRRPGSSKRTAGGSSSWPFFIWKDLCAAMERPDLVTDAQFATDTARLANRAEMINDREVARHLSGSRQRVRAAEDESAGRSGLVDRRDRQASASSRSRYGAHGRTRIAGRFDIRACRSSSRVSRRPAASAATGTAQSRGAARPARA